MARKALVGQGKGDGDVFKGGVAENSGGKGFGGDAEAKLFFDDCDDEISREIGGEDDLGGDEDQDENDGDGDEDLAQQASGRGGYVGGVKHLTKLEYIFATDVNQMHTDEMKDNCSEMICVHLIFICGDHSGFVFDHFILFLAAGIWRGGILPTGVRAKPNIQ